MTAPEKARVFVDSNVLIAGARSTKGASHLILKLGELGLIDLISCEQARVESERNLAAKLPAALPAFALIARAACRWVPDPELDRVAKREGEAHPKDLPLLVAAIDAGCQTLVTLNTRDYRPPEGVISVETPGDFVARLRNLLAGLGGSP